MIKLVLAFLANLPELLRIIALLQKNLESAETDRKVKDDLKKIETAFKDKDASKLNDLFNS